MTLKRYPSPLILRGCWLARSAQSHQMYAQGLHALVTGAQRQCLWYRNIFLIYKGGRNIRNKLIPN